MDDGFAEQLDTLVAIPVTLAHAVDSPEDPAIPVDPLLSVADRPSDSAPIVNGDDRKHKPSTALRNSYDLDYVVDTLLDKRVFLLTPSAVASHPPLGRVHLHNNRGAEQRMATTMLLSTFAEMKGIADGASAAMDQLSSFQRNYTRQRNRILPVGTLANGALDLAGMLEDVEKEVADGLTKEGMAHMLEIAHQSRTSDSFLGIVGGDSLAQSRRAIAEATPKTDLPIPLSDHHHPQPT
jgi:hypothetical protein